MPSIVSCSLSSGLQLSCCGVEVLLKERSVQPLHALVTDSGAWSMGSTAWLQAVRKLGLAMLLASGFGVSVIGLGRMRCWLLWGRCES